MRRTRPDCREDTVVAGTAEVELATKVESPTRESYHVAHTASAGQKAGNPGWRLLNTSDAGQAGDLEVRTASLEMTKDL